ncbi:DNA adenine methylase [Macrococcus sp. EM39E]|uniref:DNA adenine methylase n=1 Tax=Macrococcus animalis TaxID=3395467 RepID=UPI0039BE5CDE
MDGLSWEDILNESENELYSESDFKKDIEKLNNSKIINVSDSVLIEQNQMSSLDKVEFKKKLSLLKFKKSVSEIDIINIINNTQVIVENKKHKFPQANSIETAIFTLNLIINEEEFINNAPNGADISKIYGFAERQGFYYGDFLEYLGFLDKIESKYYPTGLALEYKRANERERIIMIVKAIMSHNSIREYYLLKKDSEYMDIELDNYLEILREDTLMQGFSESTIRRRKSTVESMLKWVDKVTLESPKPFVKWAGGKQKIIKELVQRLPNEHDYDKYIEPFAGGAALLYKVKFKQAIINDLNLELINTYEQIKKSPTELIALLQTYNNTEEDFYRIRELDRNINFIQEVSDLDRAARFIYLNKTCFNGLYRVNSKGHFNTPYGRYKNDNYKNSEILKVDSQFFNENNVEFTNTDFENVIKDVDDRTFIYLDPPYDPISKTASFTSYTDLGFDRPDQLRLKSICDDLSDKGVKIMISNHHTAFIYELFGSDARYKYEIINVQRNIASSSKSRGEVEEVIITNY